MSELMDKGRRRKRPARSLKSFAYGPRDLSTRPDPFFEFDVRLLLAGVGENRRYLRDWQVMFTGGGQKYVIARTKFGCEFIGPLCGISYHSLIVSDDESAVYILMGKPWLYDDLEDWNFFCSMSGIDSDRSIDITHQVWRLALAMNGRLKKPSAQANGS